MNLHGISPFRILPNMVSPLVGSAALDFSTSDITIQRGLDQDVTTPLVGVTGPIFLLTPSGDIILPSLSFLVLVPVVMAGYDISRSSAAGMEEKNFDLIYKLLVIGDSNVGKTTLLTRFCENRYHSNFMSTVGMFLSKG